MCQVSCLPHNIPGYGASAGTLETTTVSTGTQLPHVVDTKDTLMTSSHEQHEHKSELCFSIRPSIGNSRRPLRGIPLCETPEWLSGFIFPFIYSVGLGHGRN